MSTCRANQVPSHWENYISISFHSEWDMIVVTVFLRILNHIHSEKYVSNSFQIEWNIIVVIGSGFPSTLNQIEFHLVLNRKENCHHDHIPFDVKRNRNIVFSVYRTNFTNLQFGRLDSLQNCVVFRAVSHILN